MNSAGQNDLPAEAVQEINHGFITIDPNSYSTSTPSNKYPHSKYISKRQFIFYGGVFPGQGKEQAGQPGQGQAKQPGQAQPEQQQPNAAPTQPQQQQPEAAPAQPQQQQPEAAPAQPQQQPKETAPTQKEEQQAAPTGQGITSIESRVIQLTNDERRKNGLPDLKPDTALSNVAREKSNDMQKNNYFSHTSPTYGSPFDMMRDFGISYKSAGENIAQGQRSPEEVVQAWMNSEGHRKNILSPNYTHIGVGHVANGNYWTQMFISK
ncbi:CAP domain-containing protein [Cytobacillus sp. FJAT-54145]|uniref:CAP domain-containing protein n=1 Tax=Cytobacillus spartinae TaxID=3299023 RepID=A0ABW6K5I6_9BACI